MFSQKGWKRYQKMLKKGSLCTERIAAARYVKDIRPAAFGSARVPMTKTAAAILGHEADKLEFEFSWTFKVRKKSLYWYVLVADCYLENYPAKVPEISYEMIMLNGESHLPSDQMGMQTVHSSVLYFLLLGAFAFAYTAYLQYKKVGQIHLVVVLLGVAYMLQLASTMMEVRHLYVFTKDGKGLRWRYTWFAFDFLADVCQNLSELIICVLLLAISFGWTLKDATPGLLRGWNLVALGAALGVLQTVLMNVGRKYEDHHESFHDFEHWPGKVLMLMRVALSVVLNVGIISTLRNTANEDALTLLRRLRVVGTFWFTAFPVLVSSAVKGGWLVCWGGLRLLQGVMVS